MSSWATPASVSLTLTPLVHSGRDLHDLYAGHLQLNGIDTMLHVPHGDFFESQRRNVVHRVPNRPNQHLP